MVSNPNYYSQSTTSSFNQIEDGVDFPHTGIIKSLSDGLGQNYAISGFDITIDSATQIDVGAGVIFRDGKKVSISAVNNLALGRTTASENSYHLVSVASNDAIVIRSPSAKDKVPDYTTGDTIIAVVTHNGNNPMPIQYLTVNKTEHSVSIGYDDSGYTEAMSIEGSSTKTTFHNKIADADVRFVLGDNTADEKFEIVTDDDADGDLTDTLTEVFSVDGTGVTSVKSLSLGTAAELTITESSDNITIKNTVSNKDINFNVNDDGSDTEVMRIDGALSSIRIGQSTSSSTDGPDAKLDVRGANDNTVSIMASGAIAVENSVEVTSPSSRAYAFLSIDNGDAMVGGNLRLDDSVSGGTHDGFASGTNARGGAGIVFTNTSSNDDGQIKFLRQNDSNDDTWTVKESMRIDENGRVGIGTINPTATLEVATGGTFRSPRLPMVSVSASTTLTEATHAGAYLKCAGNVTLPATSTEGEHYTILNTTTGNITVSPSISTNINGGSNGAAITVATYNAVTCIAIGSNNWIALGV